MKITGENIIAADKETVWQGLNDPEILRRAIPGCEELQTVGENAFKAIVTTRIGPVSARFEGQVSLSDLNPPHGYTLSGGGSAGPMGNARGAAKVKLETVAEGTKLTYEVDAEITGKIAQLGARLIQSTAGVLAGQFFRKFAQAVAPAEGAGDGAAPSAAPAGPLISGAMRWIVIAAGVAAVAIAIALLG